MRLAKLRAERTPLEHILGVEKRSQGIMKCFSLKVLCHSRFFRKYLFISLLQEACSSRSCLVTYVSFLCYLICRDPNASFKTLRQNELKARKDRISNRKVEIRNTNKGSVQALGSYKANACS